MLIRFSVENFLSFDKETSFSMAAGKASRMKSHVREIEGKRILKTSMLFGANASGKSNLIKAISFAQSIVVSDLPTVSLTKKYFRIKAENEQKPGVFQFDLSIGNKFYSYGFAVSYVDNLFESEWLYDTTKAKEVCIFSREKNMDGTYSIESDLKIENKEEKNRFAVYLSDYKDKHLNSTLFLSDIAKRSRDSETLSILSSVFKWIRDIIIIFPDSKLNIWPALLSKESPQTIIAPYLSGFDTGVSDVTYQEISLENAFSNIPEHIKQDILKDIGQRLNDPNRQSVVFSNNGEIFTFSKEKGKDILVRKLAFNNGNGNDLFSFSDESDGTKRIFDFIPLFFLSKRNSLILIDELDRSLHSMISRKFLSMFIENSITTESQLVFSTHDVSLMDLSLVRQDEIWFIERQNDQSSKLFSLNEFKIRYDKKVDHDYFLGRYGAIPLFDSLAIESETEDSNE
jgi:AAA15 family ATPase/GTPase